jgi:excisionase family DNA binding protein
MAEALDTIAPRLLTPDQAARYLGLPSRWSIYRLVKSGQLVSVAIAGKLRVDREDLEKFIEARKCEPNVRPIPLAAHRPAAVGARRVRLAPLAPPSRADGDRTVTPAAKARAGAGRPGRRSDISSVRPVIKEGH